MNARDILLVARLVEVCPPLLPLLQEHLEGYESLLPHVFMGDVTRWAVGQYESDPANADLGALLECLEKSFEGPYPEDHELIAASFLENLPRTRDAGGGIRDFVGPALRRHLELYG